MRVALVLFPILIGCTTELEIEAAEAIVTETTCVECSCELDENDSDEPPLEVLEEEPVVEEASDVEVDHVAL
jgi:hypothetical protein